MDSRLIQAALAQYAASIGGGNVPRASSSADDVAAATTAQQPLTTLCIGESEPDPSDANRKSQGRARTEEEEEKESTQPHPKRQRQDESSSSSSQESGLSTSSPFDVTSRIPGLESMKEVLDSIPVGDKQAFLDACQYCPELVRLESDPAAFLRRADYNVWAAARRLVKYWEGRREIFEDRAFLPLNTSGNGALTPRDVIVLRSGYQQILPPDVHGRPVILFDYSKVENNFGEKSLLRIFFFVRCIVSQSEIAQREGYIGIAFFNSGFLLHARTIRKMARLTEQLVPVVVDCIYAVGLQTGLFLKLMQWLEPALTIAEKTVMVVGETPQDIGNKLANSHLNPQDLPPELGGTLDSSSMFQDWLEKLNTLTENESYTKLGTSLLTSRPLQDLHGSVAALQDKSMNVPTGGAPSARASETDVYKAIDLIPEEEKSAYLEAKKESPELLTMEALPEAFLRCEEFDSTDAARRMMEYWQCRRKVFQHGRSFRKMDATGKGVLSKGEVKRLDCGFLTILPPDLSRRPVIFWNLTCPRNLENSLEFVRWWFYILSVVAEDAVAQEEGSLLLCGIPDIAEASAHIDQSAMDIVMEVRRVVPIPFVDVHVVSVGSARNHTNSPSWDQRIRFLKNIGRKLTIDHASHSRKIAQTLLTFGLQKKGIPISYGGEWKPHNDAAWQAERRITENRRYYTSTDTGVNAGSKKMPAFHPKKQLHSKNESHYGASSSEDSSAALSRVSSLVDTNNSEKAPATPLPENTMSDHMEALDEAIMMLPEGDKAAYLQVKKDAPELIEKDSNPLVFLRFANFDKSAAAKRLAMYWKDRVTFFEKRAFLPMNQTGEGTLTKKDVALLSTGHWAVLPNDSSGRPLLFHDASRRVRLDHTSQMRIMFYFNHVILQNEDVAEHGIVGIIHVGNAPMEINQAHLKSVASVQKNDFPYKFQCIHIVPKVPRIRGVDVSVPLALSMFGADDAPWKLHRCNTQQEVMAKLGSHGLPKESLPDIWGGDWNYEKFIMWQERQVRIEWELPLGVLDDDDGTYTARPLSDLNDEEKKERKRRYNILHSRRKRRRDRVETDVLNRQVESLTDKKEDLMAERTRLEQLLFQANNLVESVSADGKPAPRNEARMLTLGTSLLGGPEAGVVASSDNLAFACQSTLARSLEHVTGTTRSATGVAGPEPQAHFAAGNQVTSGLYLYGPGRFANQAQYLGFGVGSAGQLELDQQQSTMDNHSPSASQAFLGLTGQHYQDSSRRRDTAAQQRGNQEQKKAPPGK